MEPAAVADLIGWLGFAFGARDAEQGQSFLSKPSEDPNASATLLGEKMFPEFITLRSDPFHPKLASTPWGPSLLPTKRFPGLKKAW
jgi:predicted Zn-dependent protease